MSDIIKVGDVVMVVTNDYEKPHDGLVSLLHKTGVVRVMGSRLGVEFDHAFIGGHNLQGKIDGNKGWNIPLAALVKMKPIKEVFQDLREEATPKKNPPPPPRLKKVEIKKIVSRNSKRSTSGGYESPWGKY